MCDLGRQAISLEADISDPDEVARIIPDLLGFTGQVDNLTNNAGTLPFDDLFELDYEQ